MFEGVLFIVLTSINVLIRITTPHEMTQADIVWVMSPMFVTSAALLIFIYTKFSGQTSEETSFVCE